MAFRLSILVSRGALGGIQAGDRSHNDRHLIRLYYKNRRCVVSCLCVCMHWLKLIPENQSRGANQTRTQGLFIASVPIVVPFRADPSFFELQPFVTVNYRMRPVLAIVSAS